MHLSILGSARSAHVLVQEQLLHTQPEGPAVEVVTFRVNVVVVGLVIFDVVVDSLLDVDDTRLAFFNVVVDFCEDFVHGGSDVFDVAVDPCADVVDVCCS